MPSDIVYPGSTTDSASAKAAGSIRVERPEPIVKACELAYLIFYKRDLARQKNFLTDFGMVVAQESPQALYMRGLGQSPYFYVAHRHRKGQSGFGGLGFCVPNEEDLARLSQLTNSRIEAIDGPGGGHRVRLADPDGFIVDAVWGRERVPRVPNPWVPQVMNTPFERKRLNAAIRPPLQPSPVERLGHCVLSVSDFNASMRWYLRHFGLIPTDVQCLADGTPALSFNRLDRGATAVDHHSLVLMQNVAPGYMHSAYETMDIDSIGQGQQYLRMKGWKHFWGIGRHILGSQIFDYWLDPEGHELEHYADGDLFDASYDTRYHALDMGGLWAWGHDVPDMAPKMTPKQLVTIVRALRSGKLTLKTLGMIKGAMGSRARPWLR